MKERDNSYLKAFGNHLAELLDSRGMTPEDVAAIGDIETKQVYRVKNGEHSASLLTLVAIAKGLNVHPKELFDFNVEKSK